MGMLSLAAWSSDHGYGCRCRLGCSQCRTVFKEWTKEWNEMKSWMHWRMSQWIGCLREGTARSWIKGRVGKERTWNEATKWNAMEGRTNARMIEWLPSKKRVWNDCKATNEEEWSNGRNDIWITRHAWNEGMTERNEWIKEWMNDRYERHARSEWTCVITTNVWKNGWLVERLTQWIKVPMALMHEWHESKPHEMTWTCWNEAKGRTHEW